MPVNETLTEPRVYEKEVFKGNTTLAYNGKAGQTVFRNCEFQGDGRGSWHGIHVPTKFRPMAIFEDCEIHGYDKGAVIQYCALYNTFVHDNGDGIFSQIEGCLHIEGGRIWRVGGLPGDHADGFQMAGGSRVRILGVNFDLDSVWTNSCCFIEAKLAPVKYVTIQGCTMKGGNYLVYSWQDGQPHGPQKVTIAGNFGSAYRFAPVAYNDIKPHMVNNSWQN